MILVHIPVRSVTEIKADVSPKEEHQPVGVPMSLGDKIFDYIDKHPLGVRISEMEQPLGETRMKIGYVAKTLLDEGKIQKIDNAYFTVKK
jgi:hypothetical protein